MAGFIDPPFTKAHPIFMEISAYFASDGAWRSPETRTGALLVRQVVTAPAVAPQADPWWRSALKRGYALIK
ncbi:hypothetical protein [Oryzifoliimicrobium ureilyticus]|uniref:hypothetical protein n=1 Tax=Oryzifoliimicrobium ureilyticus TaxID=3113724 RepID=UPI00307629FC